MAAEVEERASLATGPAEKRQSGRFSPLILDLRAARGRTRNSADGPFLSSMASNFCETCSLGLDARHAPQYAKRPIIATGRLDIALVGLLCTPPPCRHATLCGL